MAATKALQARMAVQGGWLMVPLGPGLSIYAAQAIKRKPLGMTAMALLLSRTLFSMFVSHHTYLIKMITSSNHATV